MIKSLLKALASFLTIVAGHFLNRRPDRALLFFLIFVVSILVVFFSVFHFFGPPPGSYSMQWNKDTHFIIASAGFLILTLSAVVTFIDSRHVSSSTLRTPWRPGGSIGAILLSGLGLYATLSLVHILNTAQVSYTYPGLHSGQGMDTIIDVGPDDQFSSFVGFGGRQAGFNAKRPPAGKGYLLGSIEYEGKPATGVSFELSLNGHYRLYNVTTDKQGRFVLRLAPGKWTIDTINSTTWQYKPKGAFVLLSGYEPMLANHPYSHINWRGEGLSVEVTNRKPVQPQIILTIHKKLTLLNPPRKNKASTLSLINDAIQWTAYPGATQYQVVINKLTRHHNSDSYTSLAMKVIKGTTRLSLKQFNSVPREGRPQEYFAKVYAFDQTGHYLSESNEGFNWNHTFKLAEKREIGYQLIKQLTGMPRSITSNPSLAWINTEKKLEAVEVLIKQKMYDSAKKLLDGIDAKDSISGRLSAVTGYWYASQGKCKQAKKYFDLARKQGGSMCVLEEYTQGCRP